MRARTIYLLPVLAFSTIQVAAQQDSTLLDAGYLQLKKGFTQTISIKGSDLEQMPFANLSEALSAWLFGSYTKPAALQYVVDGNPVTDVNTYSIHDVEEVVVVENAAALVGTAGGQQELVLIRTRRGTGRAGMRASAQTGLVNAAGNGTATDYRFYHDYYATAWRNWKKVSTGISANWLRDVFPMNMPERQETTPFNLQRWRANAYLNWQFNRNNRLDLTVHFSSNELDYQFDSASKANPISNNGALHQQDATLGLRWQGNWARGLHNEFTASYLLWRSAALANNTDDFVVGATSIQSLISDQSLRTTHHLWLRDRLSYQLGSGNWQLEPSLNVSYEHIDMLSGNEEDTVGAFPASYGGLPVTVVLLSGEGAWQDNSPSDILLVTPAIDLSYKKLINLKTGLQWSPSQWEYATAYHYMPFASLSADLLRFVNPETNNRLQLFASYAQRDVQSINNYSLLDVSSGLNVNPPFPYYYGAVYTGPPAPYRPTLDSTFTYPAEFTPGYPSPRFWVWTAGASFSTWKGRLQAQYYVERRNFSTSGYLVTSATDSVPVFPQWHSTLQRADIRATLIDEPSIRWISTLNLTLLRSRVDPMAGQRFIPGKPVVGDMAPNPYSWTGGWVNRLQAGGFTVGLDLHYHFGAQNVIGAQNVPASTPQRVNSVMLPNVYAGYRLHLRHGEALEWFLETRGLIRSSQSDLLDQRRYYTLGGRFSL